MFNKKTKSVKMSIEEFEGYRNTLISWNYITEALDGKRNKFVYKPTELGVAIYSAIVQLVGRERLVNGYKLDVKKMEGIQMASSNVKPEVVESLLKKGIIVQVYSVSTDKTSYELSPEGAKLFVSFFVSNEREVGTLPGDVTAKLFEIMHNMPKYVNSASALISQIGTAFQSFDGGSKGGNSMGNDFNSFTPNYGGAGTLPNPKYKKRKNAKYSRRPKSRKK